MALAKSDQAHAAQKVNEVDSLPSQIPGSGSDTEVADAQDGDSFIPNSTPVCWLKLLMENICLVNCVLLIQVTSVAFVVSKKYAWCVTILDIC